MLILDFEYLNNIPLAPCSYIYMGVFNDILFLIYISQFPVNLVTLIHFRQTALQYSATFSKVKPNKHFL